MPYKTERDLRKEMGSIKDAVLAVV